MWWQTTKKQINGSQHLHVIPDFVPRKSNQKLLVGTNNSEKNYYKGKNYSSSWNYPLKRRKRVSMGSQFGSEQCVCDGVSTSSWFDWDWNSRQYCAHHRPETLADNKVSPIAEEPQMLVSKMGLLIPSNENIVKTWVKEHKLNSLGTDSQALHLSPFCFSFPFFLPTFPSLPWVLTVSCPTLQKSLKCFHSDSLIWLLAKSTKKT